MKVFKTEGSKMLAGDSLWAGVRTQARYHGMPPCQHLQGSHKAMWTFWTSQSPVSRMSAWPPFQGSRHREGSWQHEIRGFPLNLHSEWGTSSLPSEPYPGEEDPVLSRHREGPHLLLPQMRSGCFQPQPAPGPQRHPS